jgi:hypothetical protein
VEKFPKQLLLFRQGAGTARRATNPVWEESYLRTAASAFALKPNATVVAIAKAT